MSNCVRYKQVGLAVVGHQPTHSLTACGLTEEMGREGVFQHQPMYK